MTMRAIRRLGAPFLLALSIATNAVAQDGPAPGVETHILVRLPKPGPHQRVPPAAVWLVPLPGTPSRSFLPSGRYVLAQKNRTFVPHLLVVPVGSEVAFPNLDPFFHNVFSLFNGKRFDLGLYEAGATKGVTFSHEGVSYIFCNIHPEMSAVVLVLSTPLYATVGTNGNYTMHDVPPGNYELHVWVEGLTQPALDRLKRRVEVSPANVDLGVVDTTTSTLQSAGHLNKFGQPYDRDSKPAY